MSFTIAIDGPAAAGKGTLARAVAAHFGFAHLDTGLLYRVVGQKMIAGQDPIAAAKALIPADLNAEGLRTAAVAQAASTVAAVPEVRAAFLAFQRSFAARPEGAVIDGRDIGTVICPKAAVKLFITASAQVRAQRRLLELSKRGEETHYDTVLANVIARDKLDSERATSPLRQAADAVVIDTSDLSIDAAIAKAIAVVKGRRQP